MKTFGFIGGDLRNIKLAENLSKDKNNIFTYGMEKYEFIEDIKKCKDIYNCIKEAEYIIGPIPFSKDGEKIIAQYSNDSIEIKDLFHALKNRKLICGSVNETIIKLAAENKVEIYDIMKNDYLTVLNVIPTVEGAIQVAMENTEITIHNSNILILGYGRIGKYLAKVLHDMGANISCEARKKEDFDLISTAGFKSIKLEDLTEKIKNNKYDIIFNTIPALILDKERLKFLNKHTLLIDLASKPGGINFEEAEKLKLRTIWALALPGKVAPETAAEYIKKTIYNEIIQ